MTVQAPGAFAGVVPSTVALRFPVQVEFGHVGTAHGSDCRARRAWATSVQPAGRGSTILPPAMVTTALGSLEPATIRFDGGSSPEMLVPQGICSVTSGAGCTARHRGSGPGRPPITGPLPVAATPAFQIDRSHGSAIDLRYNANRIWGVHPRPHRSLTGLFRSWPRRSSQKWSGRRWTWWRSPINIIYYEADMVGAAWANARSCGMLIVVKHCPIMGNSPI